MKKFFLLLMTVAMLALSAPRAHAYLYEVCYPGLNGAACGQPCDPPFPYPGCAALTPTPAPTPTPTSTPTRTTPVATPTPTGPPTPLSSYNQECPGIGSMNEVGIHGNPAAGIVVINCAETVVSCADMPSNEIKGVLISQNFDYNLTMETNQHSVVGTIMPINGPCVLAVGDTILDLWNGYTPLNQVPAPLIGSCSSNLGGRGCSSADYITIPEAVAFPVMWEVTDDYMNSSQQLTGHPIGQ